LARFWKELGEIRTGMLGLAEDGGHAQPMTAHFDKGHGPLWFYAHSTSHFAQVASQGQSAVFHYIGPNHDLYACVHGELTLSRDDVAVGQYWSEEVARWYPQGQHDPDLALLRFAPSSARIWLPSSGAEPALFGLGRDHETPRDIRADVRLT
jgi:general stress protein 26